MCFFNFMVHITKECDCFGIEQEAGCADIGILASDDVVRNVEWGLEELDPTRLTPIVVDLSPD